MPNFKSTIRRALEAAHIIEKAATPAQSLGDPFAIWRSGYHKVSVHKAMDSYNAWVYGCVRAIAEDISYMENKLMKVVANDSSEELPEHEALNLLSAPNPYMTGQEFKYLLAAHLEMVGNAYIYLYGVNGETGKPKALYILNPKEVKIVKGDFPKLISRFDQHVDGKVRSYQTYEIIHLKYVDPNNPLEGVGTVQAIYDWIETEGLQQEFNKKFFKQGARIGGFLKSMKAYTTEQLEYLKKSFEQVYTGIENSHKVAALPEGIEFTPGTSSSKDMDFNEGSRNMRDKILAGFRTPKTVLGLTEDVNRANAEATDYVFAKRTILPKMKIITGYLNEFLIPRFGDNLWLDIVNPVADDREKIVKEASASVGSQPVLSINEAREMYYGLGPIEGGDEVRGDLMKTPVGAPKKTAEKPRVKSTIKPIKTRFAKNSETRKSIAGELAKVAVEAAKEFEAKHKEISAAAKKDITNLKDDEFEVLHKAFVNRLTPFEKAIRKGMEKINEKQRKEVLKNVGKVMKAVDPNELIDGDKSVTAITDMATPILTEVWEQEGKSALALIGVDLFDLLTPETLSAIDRAIGLLSKSYTDTTKALLKEKLTEVMAEGPDLATLKEKINEIFDYSNEVRADMVARTETFRIGNDATVSAWKMTGVVKSKKWYTAYDERVCEFCGPMHNKVLAIEENFFDKGDSYTVTDSDGKKQSLKLEYDDVNFPPLHVKCRCYVRPEDISLEKEVDSKEKTIAEENDDIDNLLNELDQYGQK